MSFRKSFIRWTKKLFVYPFYNQERIILEILYANRTRWMCGQEIFERSNDQIGRVAIYIRLAFLEDCGYVTTIKSIELFPDDVGIPYTLYRINEKGIRHFQKEYLFYQRQKGADHVTARQQSRSTTEFLHRAK